MHNWAVLAGAISQLMSLFLFEPRYEKAGLLHMRKQDADQLRGNREADWWLCFSYTDSAISLLPKYEISVLRPSSVAEQPGLCQTWLETPKTGFLRTRLIYSYFSVL